MFNFNESVYEANLPVKYVFNKSEVNKDFLVVVFSGFNSPTLENQKTYNYMRTLSFIDCNKLFILDSDGPRGSYYLGGNLSFEFEKAVHSLITHIAETCNIPSEHIICAGSSKGGSTAIYYGLKYDYGYIIAGAPQTKIGDYIIRCCSVTAEYMLGENYTDKEREQLNQIIFNQLDKDISTKMYFYSSENDRQYRTHLRPMLDILDEKNVAYSLVLNSDMKRHSEIGVFYAKYLQKTVSSIIFGIDDFEYSITDNNESITISVDYLAVNENAFDKKVAFQYSFKFGANEFTQTSEDFQFTYKPDTLGNYACALAVFVDDSKVFDIDLGKILITKNKFKFNGYDLSQDGNKLICTLDVENYEELKYAFYVYKDNKIIFRRPYNSDNRLTIPLEGSGRYIVQYFILTESGDKLSCKTDVLKIQ